MAANPAPTERLVANGTNACFRRFLFTVLTNQLNKEILPCDSSCDKHFHCDLMIRSRHAFCSSTTTAATLSSSDDQSPRLVKQEHSWFRCAAATGGHKGEHDLRAK